MSRLESRFLSGPTARFSLRSESNIAIFCSATADQSGTTLRLSGRRGPGNRAKSRASCTVEQSQEWRSRSEKRLIAIRANSAAHAAAAVLVVSICCQARTRELDLADSFKKPLAPFVGEHHSPYLLSRINDKRIWDTNFHLVFNQSAIRQSLDHMVGVDLSASWRPA